MSEVKAKVVIDEKNARRLLEGEMVTVRIPEGATSLEFWLATPVRERNFLAECMDVFFNKRPAR